MRRLLCKLFGWHTPNRSLDINFNSHCKYCGRDIKKIHGHWKRTDTYQN